MQTPQHIGIIMDGNRRWARQHGLEVLRGPEYVANQVIKPLVEECIAQGVKYLTLWAFSTENWHRDKEEVAGLMALFRQAFQKSAAELHEKGVRVMVIGDVRRFPEDLQQSIEQWVEVTKQNTVITVLFALNYGGRDEMVRAIHTLAESGTEMSAVTADQLCQSLDTGRQGVPDPDYIIRPGGEVRLSGFMPWQAVYAELFFTDVLMPDFTPEQLRVALAEFGRRQRRFGG